ERMAHGLLLRQGVQVAPELGRIEPVIAREPLGGGGRGLARRKVELGPIAGRQDGRLGREIAAQRRKRLAQALDVEYHALAHGEGRRMVVQAKSEERHRENLSLQIISAICSLRLSPGTAPGARRTPRAW